MIDFAIEIIIILGLYGVVLLGSELLFKKGFNHFLIRKMTHMSCGIISAIMPIFLIKTQALAVVGILAITVLFSKSFKVFKGIEIADEKSWGTLFFPLGIIIPIIIFWDINTIIVSFAALILGFGDSIAAIVGKFFGRMKYKIISNKTIEGSLTFALISMILISFVYYFNFQYFGPLNINKSILIFAGPVLLSVVEALADRGIDNLFIPLFSGVVIYLLMIM